MDSLGMYHRMGYKNFQKYVFITLIIKILNFTKDNQTILFVLIVHCMTLYFLNFITPGIQRSSPDNFYTVEKKIRENF